MLRALGQLACPDSIEYTMVYLPGGEVLDVPFRSDLKTDHVWYSEQISTLQFAVSLWLQVDEDERELFQEDDWKLDEQGMVRFGSLYLTIDFRREKSGRLMSFRFVAATDGMSNLMEHSSSLRRAFSHLLAEGGGLCGILELDGYREDEAMLWWLQGQKMVHWVSVPSEEEVGFSDKWYCRAFDGLVERWLQEG